jgi:hypothetical protein
MMMELDMTTELSERIQASDSTLIETAETARLRAPRWHDSSSICVLADAERHLGHIVNAGDYWVAFDATHLNEAHTGFAVLGTFTEMTRAKRAVAQSYGGSGRASRATSSGRVATPRASRTVA